MEKSTSAFRPVKNTTFYCTFGAIGRGSVSSYNKKVDGGMESKSFYYGKVKIGARILDTLVKLFGETTIIAERDTKSRRTTREGATKNQAREGIRTSI